MTDRRLIGLFCFALVIYAFGTAINNSIFNNYLVDIFNLTAEDRGWLELPRELPGLLVTLTIGVFFLITEMKLLGLSCIVGAAGMAGLGFLSPNIPAMVWWVFFWSMGTHVQLVLIERVALEMGIAKGSGHRLGRMNGLRSLGMILGSMFVAFLARPLKLEYSSMFLCAAIAMGFGGVIYLLINRNNPGKRTQRHAFVLKKKYSRYYVLSALFGIRKQIFITFAPWFLVKILELRPEHIARILMVAAFIGIFLKPKLGRLIDFWGERRVLMIDGVIIALFSTGYVIFPILFQGNTLIIACAICFILDDLLFTLRTARTTWLVKMADDPEDVTGAMSASVSIDHVLSMSISWIAGLAWIAFGYQIVFLFCVVIALTMSIVSAGIRVPVQQTQIRTS